MKKFTLLFLLLPIIALGGVYPTYTEVTNIVNAATVNAFPATPTSSKNLYWTNNISSSFYVATNSFTMG